MEFMLLGTAIGVALFTSVFLLICAVLAMLGKTGLYEIDWSQAFSFGTVFAVCGASIGYIVGVFV